MTDQTENRPFGVWTATALVVGTMIGAGIFVLPGQLAPFGWSGAAAWLVAGTGGMVIAAVLAKLAVESRLEAVRRAEREGWIATPSRASGLSGLSG